MTFKGGLACGLAAVAFVCAAGGVAYAQDAAQPALAPAADLPPMSAWQQSRTVVMSGKVTPGYFGYYF